MFLVEKKLQVTFFFFLFICVSILSLEAKDYMSENCDL